MSRPIRLELTEDCAAKAECEADYRSRVLRCMVEVDIAAIIAKGVQHDAG